ncbi:hypothetical protein [uncultured Thiohalocapsa sp.]
MNLDLGDKRRTVRTVLLAERLAADRPTANPRCLCGLAGDAGGVLTG